MQMGGDLAIKQRHLIYLANRQSGMKFGALNSFLVPSERHFPKGFSPRDNVFHKGQGKSLVPPKIHARLCIFSASKSGYFFFSLFTKEYI